MHRALGMSTCAPARRQLRCAVSKRAVVLVTTFPFPTKLEACVVQTLLHDHGVRCAHAA